MLQSLYQNTLNNKEVAVASLEEVLSYKNKPLISKFCESYSVTTAEAEDIFTETKKFLYLCANTDDVNMIIYEPMLIIDEMWHMFILFTKDYHDFCIKHFGYYIHHAPNDNNKSISIKTKKNKFKKQLVKIEDTFGKDTLIKWYEEYSNKYSAENLNKLRKLFISEKIKTKNPLATIRNNTTIKDIIAITNARCTSRCYNKCHNSCRSRCAKGINQHD